MIWIKRYIADDSDGFLETVVEQVTQRELDNLTDKRWGLQDSPEFDILTDEQVQQILIDHRRK